MGYWHRKVGRMVYAGSHIYGPWLRVRPRRGRTCELDDLRARQRVSDPRKPLRAMNGFRLDEPAVRRSERHQIMDGQILRARQWYRARTGRDNRAVISRCLVAFGRRPFHAQDRVHPLRRQRASQRDGAFCWRKAWI